MSLFLIDGVHFSKSQLAYGTISQVPGPWTICPVKVAAVFFWGDFSLNGHSFIGALPILWLETRTAWREVLAYIFNLRREWNHTKVTTNWDHGHGLIGNRLRVWVYRLRLAPTVELLERQIALHLHKWLVEADKAASINWFDLILQWDTTPAALAYFCLAYVPSLDLISYWPVCINTSSTLRPPYSWISFVAVQTWCHSYRHGDLLWMNESLAYLLLHLVQL